MPYAAIKHPLVDRCVLSWQMEMSIVQIISRSHNEATRAIFFMREMSALRSLLNCKGHFIISKNLLNILCKLLHNIQYWEQFPFFYSQYVGKLAEIFIFVSTFYSTSLKLIRFWQLNPAYMLLFFSQGVLLVMQFPLLPGGLFHLKDFSLGFFSNINLIHIYHLYITDTSGRSPNCICLDFRLTES